MKQRFSSLDVRVIAHELSNSLCTLRLSNAYDLSSRIFLLKFAKPNHRQQLVVDSGFRCHLSNFARSTAAEPSAFVARLRKFLRTRRVTAVVQVGTDRVIDIQFSEGQYRLFLEFYAGGNIILTDRDLKIIALLRIVSAGEEQEELRVGLTYSIENRQNYAGIPPLTEERIRSGLESALAKNAANATAGKKRKTKADAALRKALATSLPEYPPMLLDHAFTARQFDSKTTIEEVLGDGSKLAEIIQVLGEARKVIDDVMKAPIAKGYIIAKPMSRKEKEHTGAEGADQDVDKENETLMYDDFHPFKPAQFVAQPDARILEYEGFNATVDEFFSSIESQKLESRLTDREELARRKLEAAKSDHAKRVGGLQQVQELNVRKAQAIESNTQRVDEATAAINSLLAQGMDWVDIARLIEMEQSRGNAVAEMIKLPLKLYENTATLLLAEESFEEVEDEFDDETDSEVSDSEDEDKKHVTAKKTSKPEDKRLAVDIDLGLSSWSNARQYYDQKKTAAVKEEKTLQSSAMALKSAEQKITADLKKGLGQEKAQLRPVRRQLWFEKFYYFISSEGYLVVGGRDSQQSEILYKKYLNKGDSWVHADLPGAACLVVKNRPGMSNSPIPISTLSQAGTFAVSTSSAWDSKAIMAAWWVECEQVSKVGSTGDFLNPGMFHIKGNRNFLPPAQLLLGFGVMFRISDESKKKHTKHRVQDDKGTNDVGVEETQPHTESKAEQDSEDENMENQSDDEEHVAEEEDAPPNANTAEGHENSDDEVDNNDQDHEDHPSYSNPLQSSLHNTTKKIEDLSLEDGAHQEDGDNSDDESEEDDTNETKASPETVKPSTSSPADTEPPASGAKASKQGAQVRGKRGKRAKAKNKYADQDEEDRALAMELLGSATGQKKVKAEAETKAQKEAESQAQKERRRQQHLQAQTSGKEAEAERQKKLDHGIPTMEKEELDELALVDNFVGQPLPGDEILDSLVVCAPWDALGAKLTWRVKMQPGAQKKGKAVKEILAVWTRLIDAREKRKMPGTDAPGYEGEMTMRKQAEFIKNLRDVEVIGVVPVGKVRVELKAGAGTTGKGGKGGAKTNKGGKRGGKGGKRK